MATGGICSSEHSGPVPAVGPGPDTERLSAASVDRQFSHMRWPQRAEKKALTAGARKAVTSPPAQGRDNCHENVKIIIS